MKSLTRLGYLTVIVCAVMSITLADTANAQFVTYYAPATVYSPVVAAPVYVAPTRVYSVPTTVYAAPTYYSAPAVYRPPTATFYWDNGPLGLGVFPRRRVLYSPGAYYVPTTVGYPTVGAVWP